MRAIRIDQTGGPEMMRLEAREAPAPGPGQIRLKLEAIGVNFIDVYHRTGLYPLALPSGLGLEGAGVVETVGEGVERFQVGQRAGFCTGPIGAYAEMAIVPADRAVRLPDGISTEIAAASLLKGMTARYLLRKTFPVKPGDVVVIHAAAGGVGQIAVQWAAHLGAEVIAVTGSPEKAAIATRLGAAHSLVLGRDDIPGRVREISGEGAAVVYDSVGKDTFQLSLDCLAPLGVMVSYGNASGPVPPVEPQLLSLKGSLFLTRPTLFHYTRTPELLQETADDLFGVIGSGVVNIAPPTRYALADAAQAHADLEGRRTTGSLVLVP